MAGLHKLHPNIHGGSTHLIVSLGTILSTLIFSRATVTLDLAVSCSCDFHGSQRKSRSARIMIYRAPPMMVVWEAPLGKGAAQRLLYLHLGGMGFSFILLRPGGSGRRRCDLLRESITPPGQRYLSFFQRSSKRSGLDIRRVVPDILWDVPQVRLPIECFHKSNLASARNTAEFRRMTTCNSPGRNNQPWWSVPFSHIVIGHLTN